MCFKNLREGRHGYKKKRALRNKVKRLRAQCTEAITIHNAWVDVSARLDADQLLSDSTSDTFPLQHLSSDTAPQSHRQSGVWHEAGFVNFGLASCSR